MQPLDSAFYQVSKYMAVEIKKPVTQCDRSLLGYIEEPIKADLGKGRLSSTFRFLFGRGWEEPVFFLYVYPRDRGRFARRLRLSIDIDAEISFPMVPSE